MKTLTIIFFFSLITTGCNNKKAASSTMHTVLKHKTVVDTSNAELYDLLQLVIRTEKLDTTYRLETNVYVSSFEDDSIFLQTLLVEKKPKKKEKYSTIGMLDKCLTQADIDYMLQQKNRLRNFHWDSTRLNFIATDKYDYNYFFSLPLISVDKTKFIISYGGRGGGNTYLFQKVNNQWKSQKTLGWSY